MRHARELRAIRSALEDMAARLGRAEDLLDPATPGGVAAVAADARDARQSAGAAHAAVQALASVAAKPGGEAAAEARGRLIAEGVAAGLRARLDAVEAQMRALEDTLRTGLRALAARPAPGRPGKGTPAADGM